MSRSGRYSKFESKEVKGGRFGRNQYGVIGNLKWGIIRLGTVLLLMLAVLEMTVSTGVQLSDFAGRNPAGLTYAAVVVQEGDTLWDLVGHSNLNIDRQVLITQTIAYNQLGGVYLTPGQRIFVPSTN